MQTTSKLYEFRIKITNQDYNMTRTLILLRFTYFFQLFLILLILYFNGFLKKKISLS